ncbi:MULTISPECIES: ABC transporter ATP-binding protein [unclassified Haladaptatus]|uniref:ABC transporter ATP-binding protein n=1 Tax=unclassified Haladaptatus TaxID=2622732 RepID=UPI0023E840C1|nr:MULTISPECIES: ABC transporter ATP-binding protein [unclassified Haladaptatus]
MAARSREELLVAEREEVDWPMLRLFREYGRRFPVPMGVALASNLVSPVLVLVPAYLLKVAIDSLFTQEAPFALPLVPDVWLPTTTADQLVLLFGLLVATYGLRAMLTWTGSWGWALFAENVQHALRTDVYDNIQYLGLEFYADKQTGELMAILASDVNRLEGFLNGWVGRIMNIVVQVVAIAIVMTAINWELALVALFPAPILLVVSYKFIEKVRPKYRDARETFGELASRLENNVSGIEVVKSFTTEPFESERVRESSANHRDARWNARRWGVRFGPTLTFINGFGFASVLLVGGWWLLIGPPLVFSGAVTVGVIVMFLDYTRQIQAPMSEAGVLLNNFERVKASAERVYVLRDYPSHIEERADAMELAGVSGGVTYKDVTFTYPDGEQALTDVSFAVKPGEMVGLVGPTGSGKSTVMKLLLRFYDVDTGAIRVDGHDVRDVSLTSLRRSIGYVSQEPFLFPGTIRENLAYGMAATDAEIVAAAKRANAHEFISKLEDGYETEVGQRGANLSGGQRQRIAIARVILKDPEIIVLDEATSHVDNETELLIQNSLAELIADKTTFSIAHRLSTVRRADRILVLEDGQIVERGSHEHLLAADGLYANLWRVQVGELESLPDAFLEAAQKRDAR